MSPSRAAAAGAVGGSIEDYDRDDDRLYSLEEATERIAAAAEAARDLGFPFTLTARAENYLHGRPDLAVANQGLGDVSVLLGNGDGTFQPQRHDEAGADPTDIVIVDLNGDGRSDIIWRNDDGATVAWEMNGGQKLADLDLDAIPTDWTLQAHHFDVV